MKKILNIALGICAALSSMATINLAEAACGDFVDYSQYAGRNAWARKCGYIDSGFEGILNTNASYVEFNGCYRRRTDSSLCSPSIPVTESSSCVYGLVMQDFCPYYDCYTPSQMIVADGTSTGIEDAARGQSKMVATLASEVIEGSFTSLTEQPISEFTRTDYQGSVLVLIGEAGERLEVTPVHPVVRADGSLVEAETLREGDYLLGANGETIRLARIEVFAYRGPVWNVVTASHDKFANILVAQEFLAGTMYFPTRQADDLFRLAIRDGVDADALMEER